MFQHAKMRSLVIGERHGERHGEHQNVRFKGFQDTRYHKYVQRGTVIIHQKNPEIVSKKKQTRAPVHHDCMSILSP